MSIKDYNSNDFSQIITHYLVESFEISPGTDVKIQMQSVEAKEDCEVITVILTCGDSDWTYKLLWSTETNSIIDYCLITD